MKFQIRQGINAIDGNAIIRVYERVGESWLYKHACETEKEARAYVERRLNHAQETVIAEIESDVPV